MVDRRLLFQYHQYLQGLKPSPDGKCISYNDWITIQDDIFDVSGYLRYPHSSTDISEDSISKEQRLTSLIHSKKKETKELYKFFQDYYKDVNEYADIF